MASTLVVACVKATVLYFRVTRCLQALRQQQKTTS